MMTFDHLRFPRRGIGWSSMPRCRPERGTGPDVEPLEIERDQAEP